MTFIIHGSVGGNSATVAKRTDNSNPAVFSDYSAMEAYAATPSGILDTNRINATSPSSASESFAIGTMSGSTVTNITSSYIRVNGQWLPLTSNLKGDKGEKR